MADPITMTWIEIHREPGNPHHRTVTDVPIDGWIPVPDELLEQFEACAGYCNLTITDGVLTGLVPDEVTPLADSKIITDADAEIAEAKAALDASDYQVLKAYEASVLGQPEPYDMAAVCAERQALRNKVTAAEERQAAARERIDAYFSAANTNAASFK